MTPEHEIQRLSTYCATLRDSLVDVVVSFDYAAAGHPYGVQMVKLALEGARLTLTHDQEGKVAYQEMQLQVQLASLAAVFADVLSVQVHGHRLTALPPPTPEELIKALEEFQVLTQASLALTTPED